jgi:hypothetical protein
MLVSFQTLQASLSDIHARDQIDAIGCLAARAYELRRVIAVVNQGPSAFVLLLPKVHGSLLCAASYQHAMYLNSLYQCRVMWNSLQQQVLSVRPRASTTLVPSQDLLHSTSIASDVLGNVSSVLLVGYVDERTTVGQGYS